MESKTLKKHLLKKAIFKIRGIIMSRSFKKKYYDTYCSNKGDKKYRSLYHGQYRSKTRTQIKTVEDIFNTNGELENATDMFAKNNIDYGLKSSDRWSWPSDGGAYYFGSIDTIQADFDKEVFGTCPSTYSSYRNIWERYKYNIRNLDFHRDYLYRKDWFDRLFLEEKIPLDLDTPQDLINWLIPRQRNLIKTAYRRCLSK